MEIEGHEDVPLLGLRVVRGPSWQWDDQDNGEGNVGTVIEVGRSGSRTPEKTVVVQWDCGTRTNYRVGYGGAHDLLVLDSASAGVKHTGRNCDGCSRQGIRGARYTCTQCQDCDLCTRCYMTNKHDLHHKFKRYDSAKSTGRLLSARHGQATTQSVGLYPGARVVRGHHWEWHDQDGRRGGIGTITRLCEVDNIQTAAHVQWESGVSNRYRVGHRGKVDLRYLHPGRGIPYYKDHLMACHASRIPQSESSSKSPKCRFKIGDPVVVTLPSDIVKPMQEHHGGWTSDMEMLIGKKGHVHRITHNHDVRVQYRPFDLGTSMSREKCRWTLNPEALQLVQEEPQNDISPPTSPSAVSMDAAAAEPPAPVGTSRDVSPGFVQISPQLVQLSDVQTTSENHYSDVTDNGRNTERVQVDDVDALAKRISAAHYAERESPLHHWLRHGGDDESTLPMLHLWKDQFSKFDCFGYNALHCAAMHGAPRVVLEILRQRRDLIDAKSRNGMTSLHLAASRGHVTVVKNLMENKCDANLLTGDSRTAFYLACKNSHVEAAASLFDATSDKTLQSCIEAIDFENGSSFAMNEDFFRNDDDWTKIKSNLTKHGLFSEDGNVPKAFVTACFLASKGARPTPKVLGRLSSTQISCLHDCSNRQTESPQRMCQLCLDEVAVVLFEPCGHVVNCRDCARRSKRCFECKELIQLKTVEGEELPHTSDAEELLQQLNNLSERNLCNICMEKDNDVVFVPCGHVSCKDCAHKIKHKKCHNCRLKIDKFQEFFP